MTPAQLTLLIEGEAALNKPTSKQPALSDADDLAGFTGRV